jgi:hypothetical protein
LDRIEIPSSLTILEESSFEGCAELEFCLIDGNSKLITISGRALARCTSLRSFSIPQHVGEIGSFSDCIHLYRLKFASSKSLKRIIASISLDDASWSFGVSPSPSLFRIDIEDGGEELNHPGWASLGSCEGDVKLWFVREYQ